MENRKCTCGAQLKDLVSPFCVGSGILHIICPCGRTYWVDFFKPSREIISVSPVKRRPLNPGRPLENLLGLC